jgi:Ulp1 family protease
MVENALSLRPRTYVNDAILNFAWKQCSEQYLKGQSKGNLRVCSFPSFFITNLLGEGGEETYDYKRVSTWLQKVFGKDTPPLQYDVIVFLRHQANYWWTYVMLPKAKHLKGLDSFGMNDQFRNDLMALWRWLNGDLHFQHGLGTPLDSKKWHINANCGGVPRQTNTWDCGLYAIHMGFCCALQAPFTELHHTKSTRIARSVFSISWMMTKPMTLCCPTVIGIRRCIYNQGTFLVKLNICTT